ncbi:hypothetical protein [Pontibacter diazotrophicus]|nr:hypothetical protein [Pontibacter diazotrophicus]
MKPDSGVPKWCQPTGGSVNSATQTPASKIMAVVTSKASSP